MSFPSSSTPHLNIHVAEVDVDAATFVNSEHHLVCGKSLKMPFEQHIVSSFCMLYKTCVSCMIAKLS